MKQLTFLFIFVFTLSTNFLFAGVTGKITGTVTDADNGEPLPGANIVIEGTMMGAATNLDGQYVILNVPPGTYNLKVLMMGYAAYTIKEVRVKIDQTTTIDFSIKMEVISGEEVTIVAERPPVEQDVAASKKNITTEQITALPVTTVTEVMGLQAGITSKLGIRGGGSNETLFMVDGVSLRDGRTNEPFTQIPLSAVQELSVQTGGFSAEYSNVRSGVVNVVTKEGDKNRYSGTITMKYKPPAQKHFGISPYDPNSYWLRPYLDDAVCWTGTKTKDEAGNLIWDEYTQRQYPSFEGWNVVSNRTLQDTDSTNDLTPEAAQKIFRWQHRKQGDIKKPDYNVDLGFGGPVPGIGKSLGDLRFFASYRKQQDTYLIQLSRDALTDQSSMLKLTSDINKSMKLTVTGFYGEIYGTTRSATGGTTLMEDPEDIAYYLDKSGFTVPWRIYTNIYWCPTSQYHNTISAKLTHVLSQNTFYEALVKRMGRNYRTGPPRYRDTTKKNEIFDGYFVDEAPVGFFEEPIFGVGDYMGMGGAVSTSRDTSDVFATTLKFDLVSQIDIHNQIKTGIEFVYNDFDMRFAQVNKALPEGNNKNRIQRSPYQITAYLQDKIEFKGFISTLGLIMDYNDPNGKWYDDGDNHYNRELYSQDFDPNVDVARFMTKDAKSRFTLSPRLAVSHPITVNSKLYFNYGHYRQIINSERLYRVQRSIVNQTDYIGDPTLPLERTISYELGYDHALFNDYLFHLAAYYRDIADQYYWVYYYSYDGKVNYQKLTSNSYEDIRGFEIDLEKRWGRWFTGNINYEYRVATSGHFGTQKYFENPAEQREFLLKNPEESKPLPQPRFKAYLNFQSPLDYGAAYAGLRPLGGWYMSLIARYTAGAWDTWNPGDVPGIKYNVQWRDYHNVDLKAAKVFKFGKMELKFFLDVYNLFNVKYFSTKHLDGTYAGFLDKFDYEYYMKSLHMPTNVAKSLEYGNIPGDDRPGDYRKQGVEYVPMEWIANANDYKNPNPDVIYYDSSTKRYVQYSNNEWSEVSSKRIDHILEDKAYIDMPNQTFLTFLNPRSVFFGITVNYNF